MSNFLINIRLNNLQAEIDLLKSVNGLTNPLTPGEDLNANSNNIVNVGSLTGEALTGNTLFANTSITCDGSITAGSELDTQAVKTNTIQTFNTPALSVLSNVVSTEDLYFNNIIGTTSIKTAQVAVSDPDAPNTERITLNNNTLPDPNRSGVVSLLSMGVYNSNPIGPVSNLVDTYYQPPTKSGLIANYNPSSSTIALPVILTLTVPINLNGNTYSYFVPLFKLPFSYFPSAYYNFYSVLAGNFNFSVEWAVPNGTGQTELPMALVVVGNTINTAGLVPLAWDDGQGITSSEEGDPVVNNYYKESVILQSNYLTTTGVLSNGPIVGMLVQSNLGSYRNLVGYNRETLLSGISYEASIVSSSYYNTPIPSDS